MAIPAGASARTVRAGSCEGEAQELADGVFIGALRNLHGKEALRGLFFVAGF